MQQTNAKPIQCPPARKSRKGHASPSSCVADEYQVGRVRAWLYRNAGILSIVLCWALAFATIAVPAGPERFATAVELTTTAIGFLGFGVGWIVSHGKGER